ncbi:MAG TPA: NAD(P)/FAD-dependent oxidoreductase [Burkholderiales bacterium]|nr:NAD(P)/FAD-dependent oxidoreductase [Burkholderiales bacterium]
MTEKVDTVVIGAGVVGLAVARELALAGREVIVLEAEESIGSHTSSRNSEVIHAGIYYPAGSLKARLCVRGRALLYDYCRERGVPHDNCGKVLVAAHAAEIPTVLSYIDKAAANGVTDLRRISLDELRELEPAVQAVAAVYSPSTGIVDSHALMLSLQGDLERHGGTVVFLSPVLGGAVQSRGIALEVGGSEPMTILCDALVNSAGLVAPQIARTLRGLPERTVPPQYFAKGHYYTLSGRSPFRRLVYPMAGPGFLGVHVTVDLGGQARFGPDITWIDHIDYSFDNAREPLFYEAIRRYYPALKDGQLQPGYTGIRPKISGPKEPAPDFVVQGPREHGVPGLVNLYGIESPGLTASLAIAEHVRTLLEP